MQTRTNCRLSELWIQSFDPLVAKQMKTGNGNFYFPGMAIASQSHRIERFFFKNIASKNRIDTHKKNHISNRIAYMMKKSAILAIFVGRKMLPIVPSFISSSEVTILSFCGSET